MRPRQNEIRVLYSFPHRLGAARICYTAWQQVNGLATAGADVEVMAASFERDVPPNVKTSPTLSRGPFRLPYRVFGSRRTFALHDYIVSKRLQEMAGRVDIVHTWPLGALRTLTVASRLGIPTVMERPNAHTRFAYEVVRRECEKVGVRLPPDHEHAYKAEVLKKEEAEYALATKLLCPSDFVAQSFIARGFPREKLARHQYGFDEKIYFPGEQDEKKGPGLTMLFVGGCAPRKGVHYALEAWLRSPACEGGEFLIAGEFVPGYEETLGGMLAHRSVRVLGHRRDVPQLMRQADILILPSVEEGSALVTSEARGSGCVLLVSEAAGAVCQHMQNALVHSVGDVSTLADHITLLHQDRSFLKTLRAASLDSVQQITWNAAGGRLLDIYWETINEDSK